MALLTNRILNINTINVVIINAGTSNNECWDEINEFAPLKIKPAIAGTPMFINAFGTLFSWLLTQTYSEAP